MKKEAAQKVSDNEIINQDINGILVTGRNGRITNNQVEEELDFLLQRSDEDGKSTNIDHR